MTKSSATKVKGSMPRSQIGLLLGPAQKSVVEPLVPSIVVEDLTGRKAVVYLLVNARAKRISLRIDLVKQVAFATAPHKRDLPRAAAFAQSRGQWVLDKLTKIPQALPFTPGAMVPVRDMPHQLVHAPHLTGLPRWIGDEPVIVVPGPLASFSGRIQRALQSAALGDIRKAAARYSTAVGRQAGPIRVKEMKSRWGSCASDGTMSFSWRLIFAPSRVLEYVAAHECAHLIEMNHGPKFWALVDRIYGEPGAERDYLVKEGPRLMRYGRGG